MTGLVEMVSEGVREGEREKERERGLEEERERKREGEREKEGKRVKEEEREKRRREEMDIVLLRHFKQTQDFTSCLRQAIIAHQSKLNSYFRALQYRNLLGANY